MRVKAHTSIIGETGYNNHSRNFFTALNKLHSVKVRNFTVGKSWRGNNKTPHEGELYLSQEQKEMLFEQVLWGENKQLLDFPIYSYDDKFIPDVNIILEPVNHHLFYQNHEGYNIGYNVWETTRYPDDFFKLIHKYDQFWVPSKWQKDNLIKQGYPEEKIKIVPEGIDPDVFKPSLQKRKDKFTFLLFGKWEYRKSTEEILSCFLEIFKDNENVELICSIDNAYRKEGREAIENKLKSLGMTVGQIKLIHFPPKEEYINYLQQGDVFISCSRGEGWNLPLIEAMSCGIPSIYSSWGAQLEFAENKGIPVKITKEIPAIDDNGNGLTGNYCEPDWEDLKRALRYSYSHNKALKEIALKDSLEIRQKFTWENAAKISDGYLTASNIVEKRDLVKINFLEGCSVSIEGESDNNYEVSIKENNKEIYGAKIKPKHWSKISKRHFGNYSADVFLDGKLIKSESLSLKGKNVKVNITSNSLGDNLAWIPQIDRFQRLHKCNVFVHSQFRELFEKTYPNLSFLDTLEDCYASYSLGYYFGEDWANYTPIHPKTVPLGKVAADILGIEYEEKKPKLAFTPKTHDKKYVCIATQSTAQAKYWNNPKGWELVIEYLNSKGYEVWCVDRYSSFGVKESINIIPKGAVNKTGDISLEERMSQINGAEFFVGLSSGLSWLAWALDKPVVLISGFTSRSNEFDTPYRVLNENVCNSCWNDLNHSFEASNWLWCPRKKNFECSSQISFEMVKSAIDLLINRCLTVI